MTHSQMVAAINNLTERLDNQIQAIACLSKLIKYLAILCGVPEDGLSKVEQDAAIKAKELYPHLFDEEPE